MRLADKVALITGAGSGMGREAAILFASEGARVAVIDVDEKGAKETTATITAAGGKAFAFKADVAQSAEVEAMVAATIDQFGTLNVVYNNAGIEGASEFLAQMKEADFDRVIAINL